MTLHSFQVEASTQSWRDDQWHISRCRPAATTAARVRTGRHQHTGSAVPAIPGWVQQWRGFFFIVANILYALLTFCKIVKWYEYLVCSHPRCIQSTPRVPRHRPPGKTSAWRCWAGAHKEFSSAVQRTLWGKLQRIVFLCGHWSVLWRAKYGGLKEFT